MRKILVVLVTLMLLIGCANKPAEAVNLSIISPSGAPAFLLVDELAKEDNQVEVVAGADPIQAALLAGEKDVIFAPINLGAKLISEGKINYTLDSILTWGNLFIVSRNENPTSIALFGEAAVPGKVVNSVLEELQLPETQTWVPSVAEAQALLLSGQVDAALIAQPAVVATMAKAKENNVELSVIKNIQEVYSSKYGVNSYPQAAMFVKEGVNADSLRESLIKLVSDINADSTLIASKLETVDHEALGLPKAPVVEKAFPQMGINVKPVAEVSNEVDQFLKLFNIELNK